MFEASYLNAVSVSCLDHPRNPVTFLCLDHKCNENPYLCNECLTLASHKQKHYGHDLHLKEIIPAAGILSDSLRNIRKPIKAIYEKLNADKQNSSLMKYQEERDQHLQSIRAHIETIKFQVNEEVKGIVKIFERQLLREKESIYLELERYFDRYRDKFEQLSKKVGPVVSVTKSYKYYASKHNILLKMLADSDPNSSIRWFVDLKRTVKSAEALYSDPIAEYEKIKSLSSTTNQLMDQLPRIKAMEYESSLTRVLNSSARQVMRQLVKFGEAPVPASILRSKSQMTEGQYNTKSNEVSWMSRR